MIMRGHSTMLQRYLDGQLTEEERKRAEEHFRTCRACQRDLKVLKQVQEVLSQRGTYPVSSTYQVEFQRKFDQARAEEKAKARPERRPFRLGAFFPLMVPRLAVAAAAAAIVIAAAVGIPYLRRGAPPRVISIKGKAEIYRAKEARWKTAAPGMTIASGDIVATAPAAQLDLTLGDLYSLRIKGDSQMVARRLSRTRQKAVTEFGLTRGKVFGVTYPKFAGAKLLIETPQAEVEVTGTAFAMSADPMTTSLMVESGDVKLSGISREEGAASLMIRAGEKSEVKTGENPSEPIPLTEQEQEDLRNEAADISQPVWKVSVVPKETLKEKLLSLVLSDTPDRVDEFLQPCALYVSEAAPFEVYNLLLKAGEAARENDYQGGITLIDEVLAKFPNPRYDAILKLVKGAHYYAFLSQPGKAIETFEEVAHLGDPDWSSLAQVAIARIYQEMADQAYSEVVKKFGEGMDAPKARQELEREK